MKIVRMYTGPDQRSHLEDIEMDLESQSVAVEGITLLPSTGPPMVRVSTTTMPELHTAPRRQYLIVIEGHVEFIVGDGTKRELGPGGIVLVEDTEGEGHIVRFAQGAKRYVFFFVPLAD